MNKKTYLKIQYIKEILIKLFGPIKAEVGLQLDENSYITIFENEKESFRFIIKEKEISWIFKDISFDLLNCEEIIREN